MSVLEIRPLHLEGLVELRPPRFGDERGFFSEVWSQDALAEAGIDVRFVQDNHSCSARGVLRGLHLQLPPAAQDKLVRVSRGAIFDVAVDIRRGSPTFGRWAGVTLVGRGMEPVVGAQGVRARLCHARASDTEVIYKVSAPYAPAHERSIRFDDPAIGIEWPLEPDALILSDKDRAAPLLASFEPGA